MRRRLSVFLLFAIFSFPLPALGEGGKSIGNAWLNIYAPVADMPVLVTDPQGRRFGYLQGAGLITEFEGVYKASRGAADYSEQLRSEIRFPVVPGQYLIEASGETLQTFKIRLFIIKGFDDEFFEVKGATEKGIKTRFLLKISPGQDGPVAVLSRMADLGSLKIDIALARKVGWIESNSFTRDLLKRVDSVERAVSSGDTASVRGGIESLMEEITSKSGGLIREEGAALLLEDGAYILGRIQAKDG